MQSYLYITAHYNYSGLWTTSQNFQFRYYFLQRWPVYGRHPVYNSHLAISYRWPVWLYISVSLCFFAYIPIGQAASRILYRAQSLHIHYLFIMIVEWYWKVWLCPWLLRITAVLLFLLSVTLVWSEVTFFNNEPVLSIFALMIDGASVGYYYFYVEVCQTNL